MSSQRTLSEERLSLLSGQGSEVTVCDVGLEQSKPATLRKNVTYIVCAVIFNEKEEVLMVQEAKPDCYKQWYLPAGRVEVGESLEEAMKREVKEEAGFESEPVTLLLIQEQGPQSHTLLSLSAADQESLQASWWDRQSELQLRGRDILRLIESGLKYRLSPCHPVTLPLDLSCRHVVQRLVLVFVGAEEHIWVLLIRGTKLRQKTSPLYSLAFFLKTRLTMQSAYYDHDVNTLGVLSLQHNGRQNGKTDGVCFNTLVALTPDHVQRDEDGRKVEWTPTGQPPRVEHPRYVWHEVQKQTLREKLLEKTRNAALVPVHSLY
uniref:Nudix (nucleoside diphosphate linked moiety X)-type motif 18 n=1 Tax=Neolamprologus brichardi TaxID=32507 RepID=A0A3Q4H382_NEOBR